MPRMTMKSETNIKLPLSFIIFGIIAFIVAQSTLFFGHDFIANGQFRVPPIWSGSHFLLLGFAVMIAMGAMYQLVPVAFLTPIWNEKFGAVQFIVTALGITSFAILLGVHASYAIYGGAIAIIGILMFLFQMLKTLQAQSKKNVMSYFVIGALSTLFLAIIAGFTLAWNFSFTPFVSQDPMLFTHITLGVAGWFTLLIFGFSYKLVPMFSLSHGFSMKWAKPAFLTYVIGLVLLIGSYWLETHSIQTVGWILLCGGFTFFGLDVREILTKRLRRKLDKPFAFAVFAIGIGFFVHLIAAILSIAQVKSPTVWSWVVFFYIMGWVIASILGYLYKIIPFLWWTYKYSERIGKEKVPTLKEMINEKASVILFTLYIISIIGLTIGGLYSIGIVVFLFQGLLTVTSVLYAISVLKIFFI